MQGELAVNDANCWLIERWCERQWAKIRLHYGDSLLCKGGLAVLQGELSTGANEPRPGRGSKRQRQSDEDGVLHDDEV